MDQAAGQAIPHFMQYGAMGILALGFIVLLLLYWRSDKRNEKYAARLDEASFDRTELIKVVAENTRASGQLAAQLAEMNKTQDRTAAVITLLGERLESQRCPFLKEERT
jgi:nanoRNase/pAp phosphatase (c-di-AMP/oligoRNAs hydrolase)